MGELKDSLVITDPLWDPFSNLSVLQVVSGNASQKPSVEYKLQAFIVTPLPIKFAAACMVAQTMVSICNSFASTCTAAGSTPPKCPYIGRLTLSHTSTTAG